MRAALVYPLLASLMLAAGVARGQSAAADSASLLPLPMFDPPPLRSGAAPVAIAARTPLPTPAQPPAGALDSPAASFAADDFAAESYPVIGHAWQEPTEALPAASRSGVVPPAPDMMSTCGTCSACQSGCAGGCGSWQGCIPLGGSPYFQALNTAGVPPINLAGMRFNPGYWFGSLDGLVMTRDLPNGLSTTYNSSNVNTNLMNTAQAKGNWAGGGQVMFGRWFGPQAYGFQFIYWGLTPMTGTASVVDPNYQLSTPFNLGGVNIGQQSPTFYFDNAHEHALWRKDGFNNFEWNALRRLTFGCCAPRLMFTGIAGLRYFRFQDGLIFGAVNSNNFSDAGGAYAAYLNTGVTNSMVGCQLGTRIDYFIFPRVRLYAQPMMGFFGNEVSMREHLYSGDGQQGFDVLARRSTVSTLGQIDLGAGYQITSRFSAFAAYRLMGVTRVGLADNQIPAFWADQQGMQNIKTNGDLILHGVMIGGMYNF
ncbi:MAG TPA: hypothetical protein VHC22_28410 [Pirellulales bacterium]|nr:hypothetical protein [Pirellulales bacterium]